MRPKAVRRAKGWVDKARVSWCGLREKQILHSAYPIARGATGPQARFVQDDNSEVEGVGVLRASFRMTILRLREWECCALRSG